MRAGFNWWLRAWTSWMDLIWIYICNVRHVGIAEIGHLFHKSTKLSQMLKSGEHTVVPFITLKGLSECITVFIGVHECLWLHVGVGLHVGHFHRHLPLWVVSSSSRFRPSSLVVSNLDWHLVHLSCWPFLSLHVDWYNPKIRILKIT